ncbi:type II toxin-antitoxin system PemK/MazF family toxin [Bacillus subtilis]|uniref:Uncharacterized protein n=1 Tax=Bacillus subtilis TaxID=1423 RepID=A0A0D1KMY7_BACIU|nr:MULTISPECIES: type II toxin-antitoxin system PemK/MazF family toxin [Bacillus subtilis group]AVB12165.1 hypothetical protein C3438_22170 [Bacillus velezensis]AYK76517.1 hypothetical protein D9C12_22475 [Bacillus subtilis subsp. subtilis]AYL03146.1 hypothetical protein D9C08_22625 [Bacillus subtilis subsp. subtilis]KIU04531.1 hypothetical protein SC09_contig8orf00196 [Bacillus subtilis]MCB4340381.1 hypothetical protein [Bacillus subtilis]
MTQVGDIYLVEVAFEDDPSKSKERPVVVIDVDEQDNITVLAISEITSQGPKNPPKYFDQFKTPINKWKQAGLDKMSYVKANKVNIIEEQALKKHLGSMEFEDLYRAIKKIEETL